MLKLFVERPVLSTVISIFFVVLGTIGIVTLPVEQYPDIAPPTVRVSATYSGANADAVMNSVIVPLEEQINGVENMMYMTSSAYNGGVARIEVFFKQGTDPDIATVNVQNRVSKATALLPSEVVQVGVTVEKQQSSNILMIQIRTENPDYDDKFIQNYANINLVPQIKRVTGVGGVQVFGGGEYAMRVWLKPDILHSYGLTSQEVIAAINDQNIEAAPGELGVQGDQAFQYAFRFTGRLQTEDEFKNIIIRSENNHVLRLKDVADVELGAQSYQFGTQSDGLPSTIMAISQTAGSNAQDIIAEIKTLMEDASQSFPPGVSYQYQMDTSEFLNVSISKLIHTLFEVFVLVFLIILVFLQNFRATVIPAIAVPVSVVGTFFFLSLFGFSINLLTLFALVLAIGMVVDDAIVVVEAVFAQLDAGEKDPKVATIKTIQEIAPAIISMTLVSVAVFLPVSFIGGTSGVFFQQFGITLAVAILISGINALTLSPALTAIFLKAHEHKEEKDKNPKDKLFEFFNDAFDWATEIYRKIIVFLAHKNRRWISIVVVAFFSLALYQLIGMIPSGFVPQEDSGAVFGMASLPPGSSMERTDAVIQEVVDMAAEIPAVQGVTSINGYSFINGAGSSFATSIIKMKSWDDREMTADELVATLQKQTAGIKEASFIFFAVPTIQGFGLSSGLEMKLQDRTGGSMDDFYAVASDFIQKLQASPEVMIAMNSFDPRFPQKEIQANIAKIKDAGLTLTQVMTTLQANIGSMYVSNFNAYTKQYRVMVQAAPEYRTKLDDLSQIFVRTANGTMAPITEFINVKDVTGPQGLTRFNLFPSMGLTIIPNYSQGFTSGDVFKVIDEIGLPQGYSYEYSGMTREEVGSSSNTAIIFVLCVVFVYLLLAALYESYLLPFAVVLSLPIGLAGVYLFIFVAMINGSGIVNNIYVQISLVMLIGLLAKTAILIVEYALQRRKQGMSIFDAAVDAAVARLRPVMMTALTCIIGLVPLAIASGAGAIGNKSIGISAIGGMMFGTFVGILVVPVLFIVFQGLHEKISGSSVEAVEEAEIK